MTLDEFSVLAKSYWPGGNRIFSTPRQLAVFLLLAKECVEQQPTVAGRQWVAELATGATAQAVELRDAEPELDAAHMDLLELEVEYDPAKIEGLLSEIDALVGPYRQVQTE